MNKNLVEYIYDSGGTRRYHNRPKLNQNVKEHSWGVAVIIAIMHPNPSAQLLKAATFHDCSEKVYGDFLRPAKVAFPELRNLDEKLNILFWEEVEKNTGYMYPYLTEEEQLWLNFADMYECYLFAKSEGVEDVLVDALEQSKLISNQLKVFGYNVLD